MGGTRRRVSRAAALAFALLVAPSSPAGGADEAPAGSVPLPLSGTPTLRADKAYVVDGPQVIGPNAEIRVEQKVLIVGIHHASLEVQGGLSVHGTQGNWVEIRNVDFSPTKAPQKGLHLDMADLHGCSFKHGEGVAFDGHVTIENTCFQRDCAFDVRIATGFLRIMTAEFGVPCKVATAMGSKGRAPEFSLRTSFMKDVMFSGTASATIRDVEIRGALDCRNVTDCQVDGCDLYGNLSIRQGPDDTFGGVILQKCSLLGGARLLLDRPVGPKTKPEKLKVDKFFFEMKNGAPALADKEVAGQIQDSADDDNVSVTAWWSKPADRKNQFVDAMNRGRIPPLK